MNYHQTLDYLFSRLPMFTRIGAAALKKDLTNTLLLSEKAGNPHRKFRAVHVAGTNGKGSVSHLLASVFQEAGYKTGLYTSPHLQDFRERIKINGAMISEEAVVAFTRRFRDSFEEIEPSFFEATVVMAFDYFAAENIDIAVIETGLGGRLDSTNIISPEISIITNIGWDHVSLLGDTLPLIAAEKAGIIKENTPVIIGETHPETAPLFLQKATEKNAALVFADQVRTTESIRSSPSLLEVSYSNNGALSSFQTDLPGRYQSKNLCTVLAAIDVLQPKFPRISEQHLRQGIVSVRKNTGLMGRWEVLQESPLIVLDVGHNEDGMRQVMEQLSHTTYHHLHIVIGMVKDKDIDQVLALLPANATYYFTNAQIPRALPAAELQEKAAHQHLKGDVFPRVMEAYRRALQNAQKTDLVLVCGSVFVVGEIERK